MDRSSRDSLRVIPHINALLTERNTALLSLRSPFFGLIAQHPFREAI
jgi:hypothetical protein